MPLPGIDTDAIEAMSGQQMAAEMLTGQGEATGASAAREVRFGRPVQRYGTSWDEVRQRLDERFPNHGLDLEQARAVFENTRDRTFDVELLKPPGEGQGERNELTQYMQHIPFARHIYNVMQAGEQRQVRNRIEAGTADQRDYFDYQARLRNERYQADRGNVQAGLEGLAQLPAFGAEMLTGAPAASRAATAVGMPLGGGATSLLGRAAQAAPGWLAGEAARAATMPLNAASSIFQRINPHVGEADATAVDVFKGYLDHQIEIASESLGRPITQALGGTGRAIGGMISRLPGGVRAAAVASALTNWATNRTGSAAFQKKLRAIGFDGLLGEFMEERAGELARGATGVEEDYGMTGGLLAGARSLATGSQSDRQRFGQAVDQLVQEGITLGGYSAITGMIGHAESRLAVRNLRAQGLSQAQAEAQIAQTVMQTLDDPASIAQAPPGPLREVAQQVAQSAAQTPAVAPAPSIEGVETPPETAPPTAPKAEEAPAPTQAAPRAPETPQAAPTPVSTPAVPEPTKEQIAQIGKAVGLSAKKSQELYDKGEPWMVQAAAELVAPKSAPAAPPSAKPSAIERMRARQTPQATQRTAPPIAPLSPHREMRQAPLARAASTGEVGRVLREAPGFESPAAMFQAHNIPPVQQAVLQARFSEAHPSFGQIAQALESKFKSPRTGKAYTRQAIQAMEKTALKGLGLGESAQASLSKEQEELQRARTSRLDVPAQAAIAAGEMTQEEAEEWMAEKAMDQGGVIVDAVISGGLDVAAGEAKLQDIRDTIQAKREQIEDKLIEQIAKERQKGASEKEINELVQRVNQEIENVSQETALRDRRKRAEARRARRGAKATGQPTPVLAANRQNPVEANQGSQAAGPAAPTGAIPPVQPTAVPGAAQAAPARGMSMRERSLNAQVKNPRVGEKARDAAKLELEYLRRAAEDEAAGRKSLYQEITKRGGLDKAELQSLGVDLRDLAENLPKSLWEGKSKGPRIRLQDLAMELQRTGEVQVPESEHAEEYLLDLLKQHYVLEAGRDLANKFEQEEREHYERQMVNEIAQANPGLSESEIHAKVGEALKQAFEDGLRNGSARSAPAAVGEALAGDAFEGDATSPASAARGESAQPSDAEIAFHAERGAEPVAISRTGPVTAEDIGAVAAISPAHAALVAKTRQMILGAQLPIETKVAYLRTQLQVFSRMTQEMADLTQRSLKESKFFGTTKELGQSLAATSPLAREALAAGEVIGGSFNRGTGVMRLDGGTTKASAPRLAGHELTHAAEGRDQLVATSKGWQNAWQKEIKGGAIGQYATTDVHEGLAEVMGLVLSGELSTEALWQKFPLVAAELEGHGWIPQRSGEAGFKKPADVFETAINDGPLHADTLLHVGSDVADDFKKAMAPAARGPEAAATANALRHGLAEIDHIDRVQEHQTREAKDYFDKEVVNAPSAAERQARLAQATDAVESGKIAAMPPGMRSATEDAMAGLVEISKRDEADLKKRGMLNTFIDNYFPHIWEKPGATPDDIGRMFARRPLEGSKAFQRERTVPTIREGLDMGLTPKSWNPVELVLLKSREVRKAIMAHDLFENEQKEGRVQFVKIGHQAPEGWVRVDDKMMRVLMKQKMGLVQTGEYFMPEPSARILNNYLSPGLTGRSATYDILREYSEMLNGAQLGFGAFHAGFILMDTQASGTSLALQKLSRGDLKGAAKKAIEGLIPGVAAYSRGKEGMEFWKEYFSPGTGSQEIQAIVQAAIEGGFHLKMNRMVRGDALTKFRQAVSEAKLGQKKAFGSILRHSLPALSQMLSVPTMEYLVPVMKAGVVMDLLRHARETMPPGTALAERRAAYAKVVDSVDNRLGELAYDNLHLNRTFKDVLMVGLRSVGWNIGTWREIAGGVKDIPSSVGGVRSGQGISPRTAYIGGLVMTAAFYGALYQVLMGSGWPEEPKDYFFPKTGRRRRDGRPERVSLPSYMRDIAHVANRADEGPMRIASNVWHMGRGKINPGINSVIEMLNNENFFGQAIYDPRDPFWRQGLDLVRHVGGQLEPFSIRNLHPNARQLPLDASIAAQGFFGVTPSPSYIVNSWEQQRAIEAGQRHSLTPLEKLRRARRQVR